MTDYPNETEAWIAARLGKVTASRISDVVGKRKDGLWRAERKHYMEELLAERLSGMRTETYMSAAMLWGKETEPEAQRVYLAAVDDIGHNPGFVEHPIIPMAGCSPDLLVGDDGLAEFKCPETRTHIAYLIDRAIPDEYVLQATWQMECTGRKWCDIVSFDPRVPERIRMYRQRITHSPQVAKGISEGVILFLSELSRIERSLNGEEHQRSEDVRDDECSPIQFPKRKK